MEVKLVKGIVAVLESSVNVLSKQMEEREMGENCVDVYSEMKDFHEEMLYVQSHLLKNNSILFGNNEVPLGRTGECIDTVVILCG